jgi:hypothetical protein
MNQKLIRNPEGALVETVGKIDEALNNLQHKIVRAIDMNNQRNHPRDIYPMFFEDIIHLHGFDKNDYLGVQIALSFFRNDFPWIYDVGKEVIEILKSRRSRQEKRNAIDRFRHILELSIEHPVLRKMQMHNKDMMMYRELPRLFERSFDLLGEN